jgi:protein gp37
MGDKSGIQWTDATWNPVTGCDKVSPGCAHCYAERVAIRLWPSQYPPVPCREAREDGIPYDSSRPRQFTDVQCHEDRLDQPLRWQRPRKIFVNSMSDLFHEAVPDQFIVDVFGIMALAHWHTFQVLTKRPERMRSFLAAGDHGILRQFMLLQQNGGMSTRHVFRALDIKRRDDVEWRWPLPNVWLGVSVENQHFADERIPLLLQTPAAVRFISAEPLLGGIDIAKHRPGSLGIHWCIVGGESGHGARECRPWWVRNLIGQCRDAEIAPFVKQLGANVVTRNDDGFEGDTPRGWPMDTSYDGNIHGYRDDHQGADVRVRLRESHGGDPSEWPKDLRVREMPQAPRLVAAR